ncbi:hypothetical protein BDV96DRAFT_159767 [Lophiotrema nucula]|uniref:Uncharacterized protein n=1 Tax=Lophiotrema nucula TaxID=690887 RepID=A0A6A5Z212_9PLEO|nr:hypothetical protein BDV96DRAFT_159767 [Lophiotrema nucula]
MPKGLFASRRKSSGTVLEEARPISMPEPAPTAHNDTPGAFRVMNQDEIAKRRAAREREEALRKEKSGRFGRLSGFGATGNKARNQSFDDDSLSSSKRDSKSSSGTHSSRPYGLGQHGSTSTLPSSADTESHENMFANLPARPHIPQHNSTPNSLNTSTMKKDLPPPPPKSKTQDFSYSPNSYSSPYGPNTGGRNRSMTTSSYASTAIAPKLDGELDLGGDSSFGDLFTGIGRKDSPDYTHESPSTGRSLLAGKRAFQAEPIKIQSRLDIEPPLKSWDSRGSDDHLIASPTEDNHSPPPPVPPHKYANGRYAPVASHSPEPQGLNNWQDTDAVMVRQSAIARKSISGPSEPTQILTSSSSTNSLQTPLTSRSASNRTTPKAALPAVTPLSDDDDDNLFAKARETPVRKPAAPIAKENIPPPPPIPGQETRRVMTAADFRAAQQHQNTNSYDDSSDSDDYEDEEEAIAKREQEEIAHRKRQQMSMARDVMRRTTTAPVDNRPPSQAGLPTNGFPPDISLEADDEDEDVPLGILMHHGFPKQGKAPTQMPNASPSYYRSSTPTVPERPASAGVLGNRASNGYKPPFARGLPDDPHASFIGGGIVRQPLRESMGFNRGPASVYGEPTGSSQFPYHEPQQQHLSLIDQVQMREQAKPKYMGGASGKTVPQGGPFTGALGAQMNGMNANTGRMPQLPAQPGMMGGMNPMMGGMNPTVMAGQMPMMGMNPNGYQFPQDPLMQYQQMLAMQMQFAQMQNMYAQQQQQQDPRMSMAQPNLGPQMQNQFATNNGFLSVGQPGMPNNQRPMSIMSQAGAIQPNQQNRPYSTPTQFGTPQTGFQQQLGPSPGYTPSIAPSERSNIGLSARYRPVVTGIGMNGTQDGLSTASSNTLQASGAASQAKVKGILKANSSKVSQSPVNDDEDWGDLKARKNKYAANNGYGKQNGFGDLVHGVEGF